MNRSGRDQTQCQILPSDLRSSVFQLLREAIASESTDAWEAAPYSPLSPGWHAFLAGLVELTYKESALVPPSWTDYSHLFLPKPSVLLLDGATATTVQARTPRWLAERNVFIDAKHLA